MWWCLRNPHKYWPSESFKLGAQHIISFRMFFLSASRNFGILHRTDMKAWVSNYHSLCLPDNLKSTLGLERWLRAQEDLPWNREDLSLNDSACIKRKPVAHAQARLTPSTVELGGGRGLQANTTAQGPLVTLPQGNKRESNRARSLPLALAYTPCT